MDVALRTRIADLMRRHAFEQTELLGQIVETYGGEETAALQMVGTVFVEIWSKALDPLYRQDTDLVPAGSGWFSEVRPSRKADNVTAARAIAAIKALIPLL